MTLLRAELLKLRRRPASYVVLIILLAFLGLIYLGLSVSLGAGNATGDRFFVDLALRFPTAYTFILAFVLGFGGLFAVAYAAAASGADWGWGTLRVSIARGESRSRYILVKFVAVAVMVAIGILISFLVGVLLTYVIASSSRIPTSGLADPAGLRDLANASWRGYLGILEQAAIGFAIANVARSQLAGVGAGIALYFGEAFLKLIPALRDILSYGPFSVGQALVATGIAAGPGSGTGVGTGGPGGRAAALDPTTALLFALGYLAIALLVAAVATERAEIRG